MMPLVWSPGIGLGPFALGGLLADARVHAAFVEDPSLHVPEVELISFCATEKGLRLEVRSGVIESITSDVEFMVADKNIVGMCLEDVSVVLGCTATELDAFDEDALIADFDELGLQFVVRRGVVVSATCY